MKQKSLIDILKFLTSKLRNCLYKYHIASISFDIMVLGAIILIIYLSTQEVINYSCNFQDPDIILIVLPTLLTIISIILQFRRERKYMV